MIFFHYCVLSNYFWLFIEGLYLFTLLVETFFPEKRYFYWYIIIGWGETLNASSGSFSVDPVLLMLTRSCSNRDPHGVRERLGGAEVPLRRHRVGSERFVLWPR